MYPYYATLRDKWKQIALTSNIQTPPRRSLIRLHHLEAEQRSAKGDVNAEQTTNKNRHRREVTSNKRDNKKKKICRLLEVSRHITV